jgi:catechol 2,3-dioxygenase-like lactoylglutathione lyase family enzyme
MTATMLRAQSLAVTITASDLERSIRFYTEGLGFVVTERYESDGTLRGVMMEAGEAELGLSQDDFAKGRNRIKGAGMGIYIVTDQDIGAIARQARAAGITLEGDPAPLPWGPMGFRVTDPDGFKLTLANPE